MSFLPEMDETVEDLALDAQDDVVALGFRSYTLDLESGRLLPQMLDGEEAVKQYLTVLSLTPRGVYSAFSEDYGTEIEDIIGQALPPEVMELEIVDEVMDAIYADPRVEDVSTELARTGDKLVVTANVTLTDGAEIVVERSVDV